MFILNNKKMKTGQVKLFFACVFVSLIIALNGFEDVPYPEEYTGNVINSLNLQKNEFYADAKDVTPNGNKECNCGEHSISCKFSDIGTRLCECSKGYGKKFDLNHDQTCEKCDCGTTATRCLIALSGKKVCSCKYGSYTTSFVTTTDRKCKECDCGPKGVSCEFVDQGRRVCKCTDDYAVENVSKDDEDEYCKPCDCGKHGTCKIKNGRKDCTCEFGFAESYGQCIECDCGDKDASHNCTINTLSGYRECNCKEGYSRNDSSISDNEYCRRCDCGQFALSCDMMYGLKRCSCKEGYRRTYAVDDSCESD